MARWFTGNPGRARALVGPGPGRVDPSHEPLCSRSDGVFRPYRVRCACRFVSCSLHGAEESRSHIATDTEERRLRVKRKLQMEKIRLDGRAERYQRWRTISSLRLTADA
jgi:hypothetical protein